LVSQVKLNEMVNPYRPVADYRTEITGISAADLDGVSCSLADVQVLCQFFGVLKLSLTLLG